MGPPHPLAMTRLPPRPPFPTEDPEEPRDTSRRQVELTGSGQEFLISARRMLAELECVVRIQAAAIEHARFRQVRIARMGCLQNAGITGTMPAWLSR